MLWMSADGRMNSVETLNENHIKNIINLINRKVVNNKNFDRKDRQHFAKRIQLLESELQKRKEGDPTIPPDDIESF